MNGIVYTFLILLYWIGLIIFGGYINLIQIIDFVAYQRSDPQTNSYDYVVVGCGSAGSVVALRLAENKDHSILVLEAGARGGKLMDIPVLFPFLHKSPVDWQQLSVTQKQAAKAYDEHRINWPMGRIVGGSSRLNNMVYSRGHRDDYKEWFGNDETYSYDTILTYFKKSELQKGIYKNDTQFHSQSGLNVIEDVAFLTPLFNALLQGVQSLGFPIRDLTAQHNTGFMQPQATTKFHSRWTSSHHLEEQNKPNIILQTNSLVHKVLLKANFEAYAVRYLYFDKVVTVRARKGVILCAGAVGTPKLLLLSGIGPSEHLKTLNINPKINLPVGDDLQDHVTTGFDLVLFNTSLGINLASMMSPFAIYDYYYKSSGVWTTIGCEVLGSVNTVSDCYKKFESAALNSLDDCFKDDNSRPDLGIMALPMGLAVDGGQHLYKSLGIRSSIWNEYFKPISTMSTASILPIVLHPKSRGTVRLKSNDPYQPPLIDPNYLQDPYDVRMLLKGISFIKRMIFTESMQKLGAKLNNRVFPGCEGFVFDSNPYWECYVRHLTLTSYHYSGTCKMGPSGSNTSVVGYNFKVHSTNKLYVVDASILPSLPSGNPNAIIMMLAEKAVDDIKQLEYFNQRTCFRQELFYSNKICYL